MPKYLEMRPGEHAEAMPSCLAATLDAVSRPCPRMARPPRPRSPDRHGRRRSARRPAAHGRARQSHYPSWQAMAASTAAGCRSRPVRWQPDRRDRTRLGGPTRASRVVAPALDKRGLPPTVVMPLLLAVALRGGVALRAHQRTVAGARNARGSR
ncbi:hypothetical protein ACU686_11825 [Yinghuangia aomiensis]